MECNCKANTTKDYYAMAFKTQFKTGIAFVPLVISLEECKDIVRNALGLVVNVEIYYIGLISNPDISMLPSIDMYADKNYRVHQLPTTIYFVEGDT